MRIARVQVNNYRNLKSVDIKLGALVTLVGENNSGKSNFLRAMTLPFMADEGSVGKRLSWFDINSDVKDHYYSFIQEHSNEIADGSMGLESFRAVIPSVTVTVDLQYDPIDAYDAKDLLVADGDDLIPRIRYRWFVANPQSLLELVKSLVMDVTDIQSIKMSLLPMSEYKYEIVSPDASGDRHLPYDVLARFRYFSLPAERDNFAASAGRLGSKLLVHLLQENVNPAGQKRIEQGYGEFLETIRDAAKLDEVINWQDYSDDPRAKDFFDSVSVLPNMPLMSSIFSSIRLGYNDESLSLQGLGYRNLILMAVMLNAYLETSDGISLRIVAVEEPEAHLCVNNTLLMASFFKVFGEKNSRTQLIYTTHDAEFVNKVGLDKVVILHNGAAVSLVEALQPEDMDYLANNPNTDIFKLLFSHRLILVEGITEELLIKSYLQSKHELNDIKVLSFHKGYRDIIRIWKDINYGNGNKLAVIRDYDNQDNAKREHEKLRDRQVCVTTTDGYTLETDFVAEESNCRLLVERYGTEYGWMNMSEDELQEDWRNKKTDVMLRICHDLVNGELSGLTMPAHIKEALDFLNSPIVEDVAE